MFGKINKKILLFLFAFTVIFTPMAISDIKPAAADTSISDLQKQINDKKASINSSANKKKELTNTIASLKNQQADAARDKRIYDDLIAAIESEIKETEELIEYYREFIDREETEIGRAQEEYDKSYSLFLDLIQFSCEDDNANYLGILLKSDSFTNFLERIDIISDLIEYTKTVTSDLQKYTDNLAQITESHGEAINQLEEYVKDLSESSKDVEIWRKQSTDLIEKTNRDIAAYEASKAQLDQEDLAMQAEIKKLSAALKAQEDSQRKYVGGTFLWPVDTKNRKVSSFFGWRKSPITGRQEHHNSIDIPAPYGSNIYAANDGTVIMSGYSAGYGNTIVIDHGGGKATRYSHASSLLKKVGDKVKKGDVIAKVGSTGWSTGNHLDFGYMEEGVPKNPLGGGILVQP